MLLPDYSSWLFIIIFDWKPDMGKIAMTDCYMQNARGGKSGDELSEKTATECFSKIMLQIRVHWTTTDILINETFAWLPWPGDTDR